MPNRMLRDWTRSDRVNAISVNAERFFVRLIMKVDDYGCYYADARILKADLFPLLDSVRSTDIPRWLAECQKAGLLVTYESEGKAYLQIADFGQRLDKSRSKFPMPDGLEVKTHSYIYLMYDEKKKHSKIGYSANPWARLKEVQRSVGGSVVVKATVIGTMDEERELHSLLQNFNTHGEWFKLPVSVVDAFIAHHDAKSTANELIKSLRSNDVVNRTLPEIETEIEGETEVEPENEKPGLVFPFVSNDFLAVWNTLRNQPKWKKKSLDALQASLKKLSKHPEQDAIQMMEDAIAGGWQGLFEIKNNGNSKNKTGFSRQGVQNALDKRLSEIQQNGG